MSGVPAFQYPITEKPCRVCDEVKPISNFSPTGKFYQGHALHHSWCMPCCAAYKRKNYDPEKRAARAALKPEPNDVSAARMRRQRAAKPEMYRGHQAAFRSANPDKVKASDKNKRARRRAAVSASVEKITAEQWGQIVSAHEGRCFYCGLGFSKMTLDHFVPLVGGGDHSISNIVPACGPCNSAKNAKDAFVFAGSKGRHIMLKEDTNESERAILTKILVAVTALPNAIFWRNNTGSLPTAHGTRINFGLVGSPDILGCYRGRFVGIEVKTTKGKQREAQVNFQHAFEKAGGLYVLARSPEDALSSLSML